MTPVLYFIFSAVLLIISLVILATIINQHRLRDKYNVFCGKFAVDIILAVLLLIIGCLSRENNTDCHLIVLLVTSVALIQVVLLLSEVFDWWLATFHPIYFHSATIRSRAIPYVVGIVFVLVVLAIFIAIELSPISGKDCVPIHLSTISITVYEISLGLSFLAVLLLLILFKEKRNTEFARPILFHVFAVSLLLIWPLIIVIIFKYAASSSALMTACDITNYLIAVYSISHSLYFLYNHQDVQQGIKNCVRQLTSCLHCSCFES